MVISGTFRGTRRARVDTSPVAIISFRLSSLAFEGSAASLVYQSLIPYFRLREGSLQLFDIQFECSDIDKLAEHQERVKDVIKQLKQYAF